MDIHMPVLNGVEATRQIRKFEKEFNITATPIIALTADAIKGRDQEYLSVGMNFFISKPIDKKSFVDAIEYSLGHLKIVDTEIQADNLPEHPVETSTKEKQDVKETLLYDTKISIIAKELGLDEETAEFLLNDFFENWGNYKSELRAAIKANNHESIRSVAHAIKGASGSLRLDDVYEICKSLEEKAKETIDWDYESLLNDLIVAIER
ncbi:MAG: Hpt domain-containing protein, partial [Sulfuricurvum sp.]|jgi:DNA-binding NarL/FixJ family response regulator